MRKPYLLLLLVPSAVTWACSGDDNVGDGGSDAAHDVTVSDSSTPDTGTKDTSTNDSATDAGADVQLTLDCFKPADCVDGGDPDAAYPPADAGVVCCGNVMGNGDVQACQLTGASTTCKAPGACATNFAGLLSCSSATVRFCATNAECTEQGNDKCCTANGGDAGTFHICANTIIANNSGGKISCN